ncbi:MAG: hypothetical protein ACKOTH_08260 [Solirubrobacterales bacterium]
MAHYASDSELYSDLGECLREVLCDPENADRARGVGSVIRIETVRPQARITLNLAADGDPEVLLGDCDLRPAAVITMEADAARGFFLGEVSLIGALSGGRMTAQGPVAPILRVVPLANLVAPKFQEFDGSRAAPAGEGDKAAEAGDAPEEEAPEEEAAGAEDETAPEETSDEEPEEEAPEEEVAEAEPAADEAEPAPESDQS